MANEPKKVANESENVDDGRENVANESKKVADESKTCGLGCKNMADESKSCGLEAKKVADEAKKVADGDRNLRFQAPRSAIAAAPLEGDPPWSPCSNAADRQQT